MPDSEAILSAEEVASMVAPGLCRGGLAPKPESTLALAASHEALREQVAVLTEERDAAGAAANRAEIRAFAAEARVAVLEAGLRDAIETVEEWGAYADDYFKAKWNLAGDLARLRAILGSPVSEPAAPEPRGGTPK